MNIVEQFSKTRFWSQYLGIIFVLFFVLSLSNFMAGPMQGMIYMFMALVIYLLPGIFLIKYASTLKNIEQSANQITTLEEACRRQGGYMRYIGIVTLILIVLLLLFIVLGVLFGASAYYQFMRGAGAI